ncbi:MAG: T9SS type A sorting domain-containing protein [Bacteroidetes bacterium]|nr:T9SS type A sorting domain-containing protein [Bacteroidota bacterium]
MKKLFLTLLLILSLQSLSYALPVDSTTLVDGHYNSSITLSANKVYLLKGFVYMEKNTTLTIPAGTIIRGDFNTKGTLIIQRGAQINAVGTVSQPIIFTSNKPAGQRATGDWGGLIILGRAGINTVSGADSNLIEGLPPEVTPAYYGGQPRNDADNSGTLKYCRFEFGGINLTGVSGNEINGLTLGGVGSGTTIDYIQISYAGDDAVECFGGTVNLKHMIAYKTLDDCWDTDNGYRGYCQFLLAVSDSSIADQSKSNGFECDNNANSPNNYNSPRTQVTYSNVTMIGPKKTLSTVINPLFGVGAHLRRNNLTSIYNTIIMGWPKGPLFDGTGVQTAMKNDTSKFRSNIIAGCPVIADTAGGSGVMGSAVTFVQTSGYNNRTYTNNTDVGLANPYGFYGGTPDFRPTGGSAALSGGNFTYPNLANSFFTPTTYVGAFDGTTDWTAGWANWDPQNFVIGIKTISSEVPAAYKLSQNYPNPFNPTTKISFSVVKSGFVSLKVYDMTGKEVSVLVNETLGNGTYSADFNAANLTSGVYFYTLKTDNFSETKKMMLVK